MRGKQVTIYVNVEVWEAAREKAWREKTSVSAKVGSFLEEWIGKERALLVKEGRSQAPASWRGRPVGRGKRDPVPAKPVQGVATWQKASNRLQDRVMGEDKGE